MAEKEKKTKHDKMTFYICDFNTSHGIHVFELWVVLTISSRKKGLKISGLLKDLNPDLLDAGAVLYQLSYLANKEQVVRHVDGKPFDDGYRSM